MKVTVFYFLCFCVEAIILWQYTSHLFIPKHPSKVKLFVLCSLYTLLFGVSLFNIKWLNMCLYLLANYLFLITQYKIKHLSACFHSAVLAAVMGMCELLIYSIVEHFMPHFFSRIHHFNNTIIFIIFSKLLFFAVIRILIHLIGEQKKFSQHYDNSAFWLAFVPISAILVMLTFLSISDNYTLTSFLDWMISLSAMLLLATNLLVFGVNQYNQRKSLEYTEMQLLLQKESDITEYYKMLLSQNENQTILIHDIKKHLQSIELLNLQQEHNKISNYIQQLLCSSDLRETSRICDHELLNAILSRYKQQCINKHIEFVTDIRSGTINFLADNDLTSLFCNLLDNSMDAAGSGSLQNSFIELNISKRETTPFVIITVINSCQFNPFSTSTGKLLTQKSNKNRHGFGLKSIRKIVTNYHGDMEMYYNNKTFSFHTIITLKQY